MHRALAIIAIATLLQGCVAAFVAGAAAGGAVVYDRRNIEDAAQDHNITYDVNQAINASKTIYSQCRPNKCHIEVATFNHVVLLIGEAPNEDVRQEAAKLASNTKHVEKVFNETIIGAPLSSSNQLKDSWITTKVKSALVATKSLKSGDLKVVTTNAVVYLMGVVTPSQAELAVTATRRVEGVKKVVTLLQTPT